MTSPPSPEQFKSTYPLPHNLIQPNGEPFRSKYPMPNNIAPPASTREFRSVYTMPDDLVQRVSTDPYTSTYHIPHNLAQPANFRKMLQSGHILWGTGCKIASKEPAKIVAALPHNFCFIDTEHTPLDPTLLTEIIQAIQYRSGGAMVPIVRVCNFTLHLANYALNAGAGAIILAHVQTPTDALDFVRLTKFPPLGDRSYPPLTLFGSQTETNPGEGSVYDVWNKHAAVFCQIEDKVGVENVEMIASVEGLDGLMVGANDLRMSLGLEKGSPDGDEPVFVNALKRIQDTANRKKLPILGFAVTEAIIKKRIELGWRALICHADISGIFNSGTENFRRCVMYAKEVLGDPEVKKEALKLYGYEQNPRTRVLMVIAKAEHIEIELVKVVPRDGVGLEEYKTLFPMSRGKIPGLAGLGGFRMTETIAIASYLAAVKNRCGLLGTGAEERAKVLSWMSWANQELLPALGRWFLPLIAFKERPIEASTFEVEKGRKESEALLDGLEKYLVAGGRDKQYLVGEQVTIADIMVMMYVGRGLQWVLDDSWRYKHLWIMDHFHRLKDWKAVSETGFEFPFVSN